MATRRFCLITGASAGIGEALARTYAAHGFDLGLVARRADRLEALAQTLCAEHGVDVVVLPADLSDPGASDRLLTSVATHGRTVDVLVNNAGYGLRGRYATTDWAVIEAMLELMLVSVCRLSRAVMPEMIAQGYGRILNVASVAGMVPGRPTAPLYNATKAFLIRASQGLHEEALGTGVHVTALCPGYTRSEFHDVNGARAAMDRLPGFMWLSAEQVAEAGYAAAEANRAVCVPGAVYKFLAGLAKVTPDDWILAAARRRRRRPAGA